METPHYGHLPIEMTFVDGCEEIRKTGDYTIRNDERGVVFTIAVPYHPNKKPGRYILTEWTIDHKNESDAQWTWDQNKAKPTLQPSLHAVGIWHGWVKKGKLVEA